MKLLPVPGKGPLNDLGFVRKTHMVNWWLELDTLSGPFAVSFRAFFFWMTFRVHRYWLGVQQIFQNIGFY